MNSDPRTAALPYSAEDFRRMQERASPGLERPEDIRRVINNYGYLAEWKQAYRIQSVRDSLRAPKITCIDAAVLSYGLMEVFFPDVKRRLLAIHRRDMHGEECGHCVTLYWGPDGRVGSFSKSSFAGLDHRDAIYGDEADVAASYAEAYLKMNFEPLYFGVTTLEDAAGELDWRLGSDLNQLSERLIACYQYHFSWTT